MEAVQYTVYLNSHAAPILDTTTCNVKPTSKHAAILQSMIMFIVDEALMIPIHALNVIDKLLRELTGENNPFGGKISVLGGDFRHLIQKLMSPTVTCSYLLLPAVTCSYPLLPVVAHCYL